MAKDTDTQNAAEIRAKQARMIKVFESRPDAALSSKAAHARVTRVLDKILEDT